MAQTNKKNPAQEQTVLSKSEAFVTKYKKQLGIIVAVLVVVVGGTLAYVYGYSKPREASASEALGKSMYACNFADSTAIQQALKGTPQTMGFERVAKEYRGTDAGNMAKYLTGICYYKLGNTKEAVHWLSEFSPRSDNSVSSIALLALGHAYAADNQLDEAVKTFKKAAKQTEVQDLKAHALQQAAFVLESQNKKADALALYEQIKKECPQAQLVTPQPYSEGLVLDGEIDKYIESLK